MRRKHWIMIVAGLVCLCFICDAYYWVIDWLETQIPMLDGWGMEG